MKPKTATYIGIAIGSTLGSMIPLLWGAGSLSFPSLIFGTVGALVGIWIAFKMTH